MSYINQHTISLFNKLFVKFFAFLFIILFSTCSSNASGNNNHEELSVLEQGRIYTEWFYSGSFEDLRDKFSEEMKNSLSINDLTILHDQVSEQLGIEIEVLNENVSSVQGYELYERIVRFSLYQGPIQVQWFLGESNYIYGFYIRPVPTEAPSEFLEYQTKTYLHLPFNNLWDVVWGGRTIQENYHAAYPDQRFAVDLLILNDGISHDNDGSKNEDYYCYDRPLFAPGDGIIAATENSVNDNNPGNLNPAQPLGNYIIINHGNGEFSFMAHFKKQSIVVNLGDIVEVGQLVGRCGNSGNSSEPHIHYHLQNTPIFNQGDGLPAQFQNYFADSIFIRRGELIRGQKVRNQ